MNRHLCIFLQHKVQIRQYQKHILLLFQARNSAISIKQVLILTDTIKNTITVIMSSSVMILGLVETALEIQD